jgi:hypothetical protein
MDSTANNPESENSVVSSVVQPTTEERLALIKRVARSKQVSPSARAHNFLLYVGKQSLKENCPEINEQEIGIQVFGRPAGYDRSQDNIVRVNATELRKRIEAYFATDGAHESLILEIPRGSYKPVFHWRQPLSLGNELPSAALASASREDKVAIAQAMPRRILHTLWGIATLFLVVACAALVLQVRIMQKTLHPWQGSPAIAAFWGVFLHSHQQTDIVLPDSSVGLSEEITGHRIGLNDFLNRSYVNQVLSSNISQGQKNALAMIFAHDLVIFGDVHAAQRIVALDPLSSSLHLADAHYYVADSINRDNVILIGAKKGNPWVYLFDNQMNFRLDSDEHGVFVVNRHLQSGEQLTYRESVQENGIKGYSLIAYLPNPGRTGDVVILAGTDSDATDAAAEFITSESKLEKFRRTIHSDRFPYFEILLETNHPAGASFNSEIIAYRTYPGPH